VLLVVAADDGVVAVLPTRREVFLEEVRFLHPGLKAHQHRVLFRKVTALPVTSTERGKVEEEAEASKVEVAMREKEDRYSCQSSS